MTEEQIHSICKQYNIKNYTINEDMSIDVNGDVYLSYRSLDRLPLQFKNVSGDFICDNNQITSLEGCPINIGGYFDCRRNKLTSLEHGPMYVKGYYNCYGNEIATVEYLPKVVSGKFFSHMNPIYDDVFKKFNNDYNLYQLYLKRREILKKILGK